MHDFDVKIGQKKEHLQKGEMVVAKKERSRDKSKKKRGPKRTKSQKSAENFIAYLKKSGLVDGFGEY
ncbi:MAG TPA: hypothetical protein P5056_01845 [Candidatus Paceibacterota bacterium]|nr:hypothetical protein [Candidatus Paceibacterota bacterium]